MMEHNESIFTDISVRSVAIHAAGIILAVQYKMFLVPCLGSQVLCSEPTIPDLHNLVVANLPSKWMDFGIQVNIGRPILDAIEKEKHAKCSDCFSQTISTWKEKESAPFTWETVLRVLYSPAMKEYRAGELVYSHLLHLHGKLMSDGQSS